jgi:hypothetical protein
MPRPKEFTVTLTARDRVKLIKVVSSGEHPARMIARARVLLALDETGGPAPDRRVVAERLGTSESTVYLVAKAFTTHVGRVEDVITLGAPVPLLVVALAYYTDADGRPVMLRNTLWGWLVMGLLVVALGVVFVIRMRRLRRALRKARPGGTIGKEDR